MVRVQSGPPPLLPATIPPPNQPSRPTYETQTSRTSGSSSEDFVIVEPSQGVSPQLQQLQQQQYGVQNSGVPIPPDNPIIPPGSAPVTEAATPTPSTNPRGYYVPIDRFLAGEAILELDYDELQARVRTLLAENELLQESIYQNNDSIQRQLRVSHLRISSEVLEINRAFISVLQFQHLTNWQLDNQRRFNDYQREIFYLNQNLDEVSTLTGFFCILSQHRISTIIRIDRVVNAKKHQKTGFNNHTPDQFVSAEC